MNITEKINEMQENPEKYNVSENYKGEYEVESEILLLLYEGGDLGPGRIIGENNEYLDVMFFDEEKDICGMSVFSKLDEKELSNKNPERCKELYQWGEYINWVIIYYFIGVRRQNMNFTEKAKEIERKFDIGEMGKDSDGNISTDKMIRVMVDGGQILEPCIIVGESEDYIDLMLIDLKRGPDIGVCINKEKIIGFGTFNKPLNELYESEEKTNDVPSSLYM